MDIIGGVYFVDEIEIPRGMINDMSLVKALLPGIVEASGLDDLVCIVKSGEEIEFSEDLNKLCKYADLGAPLERIKNRASTVRRRAPGCLVVAVISSSGKMDVILEPDGTATEEAEAGGGEVDPLANLLDTVSKIDEADEQVKKALEAVEHYKHGANDLAEIRAATSEKLAVLDSDLNATEALVAEAGKDTPKAVKKELGKSVKKLKKEKKTATKVLADVDADLAKRVPELEQLAKIAESAIAYAEDCRKELDAEE